MKRRAFARSTALGALASTVAAPAVAQSSPAVNWRLVSSFPKTLTISYDACVGFVKRVAELTEGRFQIKLFGPGEIVPAFQVLDAVQNGTVEAGFTASYFYVGKDPTFGFATALPFGLNTRQQNAWMLRGDGLRLNNEFFRAYNVSYVPMGLTGAQMGGWFRKEIKSREDLKGLKMRIGGLAGEIMSRLGVIPQSIPAGDVYPSLERGSIDAVEYVGPFDDEQLGLHRVAKYYYYPGWWEGSVQVGNFVGLEKWNALPPLYRAAFAAAATEAQDVILAGYDALNGAALRRLVAKGTELRPFPREVMVQAYEVAFAYYDELAAKNDKFKTIYDNWKAFRADVLPWYQLAEGTYDNFVYAEYSKRNR